MTPGQALLVGFTAGFALILPVVITFCSVSWRLQRTVARLKRGDLTPEEFQNLCHNLHLRVPPCTEDEFKAGCEATRAEVFGGCR